VDERIALSGRARSVLGVGEVVSGRDCCRGGAPYFDRREAALGFTGFAGFCFTLLPLAFLAAGSVGVASTFPWLCARFVPLGFPLFLGFSSASALPTLALCREVEAVSLAD
jgi:hypothetical protein